MPEKTKISNLSIYKDNLYIYIYIFLYQILSFDCENNQSNDLLYFK